MNDNIKRVWALVNSTLLLGVIVCLAIWPERIFSTCSKIKPLEIFAFLVIASTAIFLLTLFITLFLTIQRSRECKGTPIVNLIASMVSLLFLMAVKVMADEIGHEWIPGAGKITQHGEYWIMFACLGFVLGSMLIAGLRKGQ